MYISPDVHVITDKLKSVNGTVITTCAAAYWYWDRDLGGDSACHRNGWAAEVLRLRRQLGPSHEIGRAAVGGKLPRASFHRASRGLLEACRTGCCTRSHSTGVLALGFSSSAVLYICRKRLLAESTSLRGSRAVLVAERCVFNRISIKSLYMMSNNLPVHPSVSIVEDPVISTLAQNPGVSSIIGGFMHLTGLQEAWLGSLRPAQRIAVFYATLDIYWTGDIYISIGQGTSPAWIR